MPRMSRALILLLCLLPNIVWAHAPIKGINDFYNGVLHPLFVPAHLISLVALGLLLGQRGTRNILCVIVIFLISIVAGLTVSGLSSPNGMEIPLLIGAMTVGLLVTLDKPLPIWLYFGFGVPMGLLLGIDSSFEALHGRARIAALLGSGVGLVLIFLYTLAVAKRFGNRKWRRIGIRILGSWLAASAFIALSLLFAPEKESQIPQSPAISQSQGGID